MADTDPVSEPKAPPKKGKGGKILGLPKPVAIGGAAAVLALGYLWWRSRKKSGAATASTTASTSTSAATNAQLEAELQELLNGQGGYGSGSSSGGSSGGTGGGTTSGTGTGTGGQVSTSVIVKTSTTTPTKTKTTSRPSRAPTGENVGNLSATGAQLRWTSMAAATSYRVRVWRGKDILHDSTQPQTSQTISGLKAKTLYGWHVAAVNSAGQGPFSGDQHFTTK